MTKKNVIRKVRTMCAALAGIVILMLIVLNVSIFQPVDYEIKNNCLTVQHTNQFITGMDVVATRIDASGNATEIVFNIPLGEADSYTFDERDFQQLIGTEDSIYVIEGEGSFFSMISNMTIVGAIANIVFFVICVALAGVLVFNLLVLTNR